MSTNNPAALINNDGAGFSDSTLQRCTIVTGAGSPHGAVFVTIDSMETTVPVGPCVWLPRWEGPDSASFPSAGEPAWVQFGDDNTPVLAGWGAF